MTELIYIQEKRCSNYRANAVVLYHRYIVQWVICRLKSTKHTNTAAVHKRQSINRQMCSDIWPLPAVHECSWLKMNIVTTWWPMHGWSETVIVCVCVCYLAVYVILLRCTLHRHGICFTIEQHTVLLELQNCTRRYCLCFVCTLHIRIALFYIENRILYSFLHFIIELIIR